MYMVKLDNHIILLLWPLSLFFFYFPSEFRIWYCYNIDEYLTDISCWIVCGNTVSMRQLLTRLYWKGKFFKDKIVPFIHLPFVLYSYLFTLGTGVTSQLLWVHSLLIVKNCNDVGQKKTMYPSNRLGDQHVAQHKDRLPASKNIS